MLPMRSDDLVKTRGFIGRWREKVKYILHTSEIFLHTQYYCQIVGWIRLIMSDSNSRNLLGFLVLNLTFAFVELVI